MVAARIALGLVLVAGIIGVMRALPEARGGKLQANLAAPSGDGDEGGSDAGAIQAPPPLVAIHSSLIKLRPDRPPPQGAQAIDLRLLRGECESAQLSVYAGTQALQGVRASLEGELGEGVSTRLYREAVVRLAQPSGPEGEAGSWSDPLIPERDAYAGEPRSAFPFDVPRDEIRALLLEVCATAATSPGPRSARLMVSFDRAGTEATPTGAPHSRIERIAITLQIEEGQIPATSTLPNSFGFSALRAAMGHYGRVGRPEEIQRLDRLYRQALLAHRISVHGGTMEPPPFQRLAEGAILPDFSGYDAEVGPSLEGKLLPSGAKATSAELRTHPALQNDGERLRYWTSIAAHHRAMGWTAILFDYAKDEPARTDLPAIASRARLVKRADPSIRVLLTASLDPALAKVVDLWAPNLNCLWVKSSPDEFCDWRAPRAAYDPLVAGGALLWWYQSCSSHGCDEGAPSTASYFRGWPSYVIDAPGTRTRIMGWLAFLEGIGGELYWDTIYAYSPDGAPRDPWDGAALRSFGGNGDGTLLYPGTPARIGGKSHVPVESLRLKQIRDGLEDWELLRLVAAHPGGAELARRIATRLAPTPFQVRDDPAAMESARAELLDYLRDRAPGAPIE